ncbi:stereocilin-like [Corythoichthys intestinalis]|uniref:stereocilin-like n=1 Tax=Corythoichthys intestinalis TaxID=161448 RepID=UPI0025A68B19|nr:stereocilin-like [Corythoichthys intestinalis]XP_057704385.1 stereocilin-like [Corythoichthys intestinalis]XP_061796429.1 stereocilin-like [Nerophis lumbriciformis]
MTTLRFTSILVCAVLLGQGSSEKTARGQDQQRDVNRQELLSKLNKEGFRNPQKSYQDTGKDVLLPPWMNSILGGLQTLSGLLPTKNLGSLNQPFDRHHLSGFLYNISQYLQDMSIGLEGAPFDSDDEQLWEKVLYFFLQSEGNAAQNQWNGRVPPRPSIQVKDWFLSLRGSPHWDWLLGILQSLTSLMQRQPHKPILTMLSQHWRTVSAVLEAAFQALISGTYGQASAGLQGFICALKGHADCPFGIGWLQYLLGFMETRSWRPVVSLHSAGEDAQHRTGSSGRVKPFSLPPEAIKPGAILENNFWDDSSATQEEPDSLRSLFLQALTRTSGDNLVQKNLALVQSLDRLRMGLLHRVGSSVYGTLKKKVSQVTRAMLDDVSDVVDAPQTSARGQCSVGDLRRLILWGIRNNVTWNTQALGLNNQGLPSSLPFLSCPDNDGKKFRQTAPHSPPESSPSHQINSKGLHDQRHQSEPRSESDLQKEMEFSTTAEILEAACNESIPGLSGVSNFTVFLYCKLLEWENESLSTAGGEMGLDLHATCSDAAWYLSAAEDDLLWVHVCSEFFAQEFNNTVCANSSFWLQRSHLATRTHNFNFFNQTSIKQLCAHLSNGKTGSPAPEEGCLAQLGSRLVSAQAFRRCFLPNSSALISALCGREPLNSQHSFPEGSWAAAYCFRQHNLSRVDAIEGTCQYKEWAVQMFLNVTILELCGQTHGLREHMCLNESLYHQLLKSMPRMFDFCADLREKVEDSKCLLQKFFDMLPAQYDLDTSQLCVNPAPLMLDVLHKLSVCQVEGGENHWFLVTLGYVLRVLDFMVGISSGLDEGEGEARQGLGQAILLSSLLDNTSWSAMEPEASTSVLHTVGVFLRREQNATLKEDLLSCFSPVLWDLIEQDNNSSALRVLLQEYLQMPENSIRTLVMSAEKDAVKRFLSRMHQSWDHIQVERRRASQKELQAMETMTAAFIHKFPRVTPELFVDLSQFIPFMSVSDIMSFPASVIVNDSVLAAIRDHSSEMKSPQKKAFVKRLLQSGDVGDVPTWPTYFVSSILPLLPYLPVHYFQQLTSQQLTPLVELLGNSSLDGVRGRHVVRTIFTRNNMVTIDNISRLGVLACYLDPLDLHPFLLDPALYPALQKQLVQCVSKDFISLGGRLSSWLIPAIRALNASDMTAAELTGLSALLPQLGASFLLSLPSHQVLELLSQTGMGRYSPAQAFQILSKISKDTDLTVEKLCRLKPLHSGLSPAVLSSLRWSEISQTAHCQCWKSVLAELKPGHKAMLYNAMKEALHKDSLNITQHVTCLLPLIPLRKLIEALKREGLPSDISLYGDINWSPQQAQLLFKWMQNSKNITSKMVRNLGHVATGMTCNFLRLWSNDSDFAELLHFVTMLPGNLRPALRKCIVEEVRISPQLDVTLSPRFSATLPVTMMDDLSNTSLRAILDHVQSHLADFLQLPYYKQSNMAEKAVRELGSSSHNVGEIDGPILDLLGPLLPFLDRDSLAAVDKGALALRLEEMRSFCFPKEALQDISVLLTQKDLMGEPSKWKAGDIEHLGRLMFSLSAKQINSIPLKVLNKDTVEQVLVGQKRWEQSAVGEVCLKWRKDQRLQKETTQSLVRGIVKVQGGGAQVPSCADIRGTFPSAWTSSQLSRMTQVDLTECVEVFGQDTSLSSEQRRALWVRLRQAFNPVSELRTDDVLTLGSLVTEMTVRELHDSSLTDLAVLAHLGTLSSWSTKKMRTVILGAMHKSKLKIEQLSVIELAIFGHLICGLYPSEMKRLNAYNLSMAVRFLREMSLPCTEQQMEALTSRLSRYEAFGPVSAWGPEVFTEIGTLAVGLEDIVLSALTQEQVEGLTTEAISLLSPKKMAVVFSAIQLSWLTVEQAWAITEDQWTELDNEQRHSVELARYEGDVLLEMRGRNSATAALKNDCFALSFVAPSLWLWHLIGNASGSLISI